MAQDPGAGRTIDADILAQLLRRARAEESFRDELLAHPVETLRGLGLNPKPWDQFFSRLTEDNFEAAIQDRIVTNPHGEAESEAEAEAEAEAEGEAEANE